jgi:ParB/RepB/Spo0J family partition protein
MATKKSFQPPSVLTQSVEETKSGFNLPKFPRASALRSPELSETPPPTILPQAEVAQRPSPSFHDEKMDSNNVQLIPRSRVRASPFQNRFELDRVYIADLAANIKKDGLNSPILVRPLDDGWYELLAGENRYEAFGVNQEEFIPAIVKVMDDKLAARTTVLDNIYHSKPSDYEMWKGFVILMKEEAVTSLREIADVTGYSKSTVGRIMLFGTLPEEVHEILRKTPKLLSATTAELLSQYCNSGHEEVVIEAVKKVQLGQLTQGRIQSWIQSRSAIRPKSASRSITYQKGKTFGTLLRVGTSLKVKLGTGIDVNQVEERLYQLLHDMAQESTETPQPENASYADLN